MRNGPELDLVVYGTESTAGLLECVELAERADFRGVWVGDSPVLWRELYVLLGAAAERTSRVRLGPAVTNPVSRHTAVTAGALATLQELSGGRAALGLGLGASAVRTVGARPARLAELEQAVAEVRRYWSAGEGALAYGGDLPPIPVHLGASGPRMLELAGRIGDGCLAVVGLRAEQVAEARERIGAGRRSAGLGLEGFQLTYWVPFAVADDAAAAREDVKPYVARSLRHPLPAPLTSTEHEVAESVRAAYSYGEHLAPGASQARAVPDEIVEDWAVAGTPDGCRRQLARLADLGVGRIGLVPMGAGSKPALVRRLVEDVLGRSG
jgi:5,10-methylenetetrahydromethanopterin reductase